MKENERKLAETVYDLVNGQIDLLKYPMPEGQYIVNEFQDGKLCAELYQKVCDAKQRLNERLHTEEDQDIEILIDSMNSIAHIISVQMFFYGMQKDKFLKED